MSEKPRKIRLLKCHYCHKEFKKKSDLDEHNLICEELSKYKEIEKLKEDDSELYNRNLSNKEILTLFMSLSKKQAQLDKRLKEIESLKKLLTKKKKKINIIDRLNDQKYTKKVFNDFFSDIENFIITREILLKIIDIGYLEGINYILTQVFSLENTENHSIQCFNIEKGSFYINTKNKEDILEWRKLCDDDLKRVLNIIHHKLWDEYKKYKEENKVEIDNDVTIYNKFRVYKQIILGEKYINPESKLLFRNRKIKEMLFNYLNRKITSYIEIETAF